MNTKKQKIGLIILILIDVILTVAAKILHGVFTYFELAAVFYETGCVLFFIYYHLICRHKFSLIGVIKLVCFMAMGVAGYSILTFGQTDVHADTATATMLAQAQLKYHSFFPRSWCYANGDIWVLSAQLTTLPFSAFMSDQILARVLGSFVFVIIAAVSLVVIDKFLFEMRTYIITIPVIFCFLYGANDHILYQASYTGGIIQLCVIIPLIYLTFIKDERIDYKKYSYFCLFSFVFGLSGMRPYAELLIPAAAAYMILFLTNGQEKKVLFHTILIALPFGVSYLIYKLICKGHTVVYTEIAGTRYAPDYKEIAEILSTSLGQLFEVFGYTGKSYLASVSGLANAVSIFSCVLIMFIVPLLQGIKLKDEPAGIKYFYIFALIHNIEMLFIIIFFNKTANNYYWIPSVYIFVFVSAYYIIKYGIIRSERRLLYGCAFMMAALIMTVQLGLSCRGWTGKVTERRYLPRQMIEYGLDEYKGYGTYWNMYSIEMYSDLKLETAAIGEGIAVALRPYEWLVDSNRFIPDNRGSYILLSFNENKEIGSELERVFGECEAKHVIGENYIYVWDYDICVNDFNGRG